VDPVTISLESGDGYLAVALSGELDMATVEPIRPRLLAIAASVPGRLIVDLGEVTFLDSSALGLFLSMHRRVNDSGGGALVLTNVDRRAGKPLSITGLDRLFDVEWAEPMSTALVLSQPRAMTPCPG
jgi:anti-sigma B factor antagonist